MRPTEKQIRLFLNILTIQLGLNVSMYRPESLLASLETLLDSERERILAIIEAREWIVGDDLGIEEAPTVEKLKRLIG